MIFLHVDAKTRYVELKECIEIIGGFRASTSIYFYEECRQEIQKDHGEKDILSLMLQIGTHKILKAFAVHLPVTRNLPYSFF